MSVTPNNIMVYGSANMPEADAVAVGGVVDFTKRVAFYDITPAGTVDWVSTSASDTAAKGQVTGRDPTGIVQTPAAVTLNGQTVVTGAQTFERIGAAVITGGAIAGLVNPGGTAAVGDVALMAHSCVLPTGTVTTDTTYHTAQTGSANTAGTTPPLFHLASGDGASVSAGQLIWTRTGTGPNQLRMIIATSGYGTDVVAVNRDWGTIPDNTTTYKIVQGILFDVTNSAGGGTPTPVTAVTRCFWTSAADVPTGSARYFYEKVFVVNNNSATALTGAQIEIVSETPTLPAGALLDLGLCTALNDTNTASARQQTSGFLPTGVSSFTTQPAFINVPGGSLPSGNAPNSAGAQGCWMRLTLPAGTAAYKGSADLRTQGTTT
ncbi:MAG: hypothetical protein JO081_00300 [Alphaproteobacteria bacterium]|nr:hypothetical protein [Alphaproteobacteria bacterium]